MDIKINVESIDLAEHIGTHYDEDGDRVPRRHPRRPHHPRPH
jgi:hypothetical protein